MFMFHLEIFESKLDNKNVKRVFICFTNQPILTQKVVSHETK